MAYYNYIPNIINGLEEAGNLASVASPLIQGWSNSMNLNVANNQSNYQMMQNFGQQRAMQNTALTSAERINAAQSQASVNAQQASFDWQGTQNNAMMAHQTQMQGAAFNQQNGMQDQLFQHQGDMAIMANQQQLQMQQNTHEQQSSLLSQNLTNNLTSGITGSVFNLAGNVIGAGLNYLATSALIKQQASAQRQNFDYMTDKSMDQFTNAGLPSWLAFSGGGGMNQLPRETQQINGSNIYTSALPGSQSSIIWTGSSSQLAFGAGNIPSAQ